MTPNSAPVPYSTEPGSPDDLNPLDRLEVDVEVVPHVTLAGHDVVVGMPVDEDEHAPGVVAGG